MDDKYKITEEDIDNCWPYHKQYLIEILNDEYDVSLAREDLISLNDTKYDNRTNIEKKLKKELFLKWQNDYEKD